MQHDAGNPTDMTSASPAPTTIARAFTKKSRCLFSQRAKQGFSIYGVQPGDSLQLLLAELPPKTIVRLEVDDEKVRHFTFCDETQTHEIGTATSGSGSSEIIELVDVWPCNSALIVEEDGKEYLSGLSTDNFVENLPGLKFDGRYPAVKRGKFKLQIEVVSGRVFGVILKMNSEKTKK